MKRFSIFLIIIVLLNMLVVSSYAGLFDDIMNGAEGFNDGVEASAGTTANTDFAPLITQLVDIAVAIGTVIAIVVGIIFAIKFMVDGAEGKADIKSALTPYLIACGILFGGYGVWTIVVSIMQGTFL